MHSKAILSASLGGSVALLLAGCNTLLGIHPADDAVWDGDVSSGPGETASDDGGGLSGTTSTSSSGGGAAVDAQASYQSDAVAVWANWPMPNPPSSDLPNPQSYDASSPDFVYDNVTGLTWQRALDTATYADGGTWDQAVEYCASLELDDAGWRLPARIELISLLNVTEDPAIDPTNFPGTPADEFWTSSSLASDSSLAWYVDFGFSTNLIWPDSKANTHFIRCVR
jgi:hypothetical protein